MYKSDLKEINNGIKKDFIKGANVQGFSFRAEQGLNSMYLCLHTEISGVDFESVEKYPLKVSQLRCDLNLDNYRLVFLEMFIYNSHYKQLVDIMARTKKEISFEVILFNNCDLYNSLNLECHELYLVLTDSKGIRQKYLIDKFVGNYKASCLIAI